jgi:hypothetical protein
MYVGVCIGGWPFFKKKPVEYYEEGDEKCET